MAWKLWLCLWGLRHLTESGLFILPGERNTGNVSLLYFPSLLQVVYAIDRHPIERGEYLKLAEITSPCLCRWALRGHHELSVVKIKWNKGEYSEYLWMCVRKLHKHEKNVFSLSIKDQINLESLKQQKKREEKYIFKCCQNIYYPDSDWFTSVKIYMGNALVAEMFIISRSLPGCAAETGSCKAAWCLCLLLWIPSHYGSIYCAVML